MGLQSYNDGISQQSADLMACEPLYGDVANNTAQFASNVGAAFHRGGWGRTMPTPPSASAAAVWVTQVGGQSNSASVAKMVVVQILLGSLNLSTNVFTSGSSMPTYTELGTSRVVDSAVLAEVTANCNATPGTFTVTYTNQAGTTGQVSAAVTVTASALTNQAGYVKLNAGDTGVRAITAAAQSGGTTPSGTIKFWGLVPIAIIPTFMAGTIGSVTVDLLLRGGFNPVRLTGGEQIGVFNVLASGAVTPGPFHGAIVYTADTSGTPTANNKAMASVANMITNAGAYGTWRRFFTDKFGANGLVAISETAGQTIIGRFPNPITVPTMTGAVRAYCTFAQMVFLPSTTSHSSEIMMGAEYLLGSLTVSGNVFSSGVTMPTAVCDGVSQQMIAQEVFLYVATTLSATTPTVTITYTSQDGTTSRTATLVLANSPTLGNCFDILPYLQSGDTGVKAVTNISISTGTAGTLRVYGVIPLARNITQQSCIIGGEAPAMSSLPMVSVVAGDAIGFYVHTSTSHTNADLMAVFNFVGEAV